MLDYCDDDLDVILNSASPEAVRARVANWLARLDDLYGGAEAWAASRGWRASRDRTIRLDQDFMRKHGVAPVAQPSLRLEGPEGAYAQFYPVSPWVIGANGRIDLFTRRGGFDIIDRAEAFEKPRWWVFRTSGVPSNVPYASELLDSMV